MTAKQGLRGLSTICFYAKEHEAAKEWYTKLLGIEPYFSAPGYVEFRIGDYQHELGIIDSRFASHADGKEPSGAIAYWHVDDVGALNHELLSMGAKQHQPVTDRGNGFFTATVIDPFGNILGIMSNPHYVEMLKKR